MESSLVGNGERNRSGLVEREVVGWVPTATSCEIPLPNTLGNGVDAHHGLSNILQALTDSSFMEMDRVISFESNYSPATSHAVGVNTPNIHGWADTSFSGTGL